jgi:hypothetical protein
LPPDGLQRGGHHVIEQFRAPFALVNVLLMLSGESRPSR